MPGFLSVRPQDWAQPAATPGVGGPMIFGVEAEGVGVGGVHIRATDGTWTTALAGTTVKRLCGVPDVANRVYGVTRNADGTVLEFITSDDTGATWTTMTMPSGTDNSGNSGWSHHICSPAEGTVYMAVGGSGTRRGIWKTTDHGATWTNIVTFAAPTGAWRVGNLDITTSRLWFGRFDSYSGAPAQSSAWYCNLDGTGLTAIPTLQAQGFNSPPKVRPGSDTTVIISERVAPDPYLYRWTIGEGSATGIDASSDSLEVVALSATTFLALDYGPGPPAIWRSTDAGGSWDQVYTFDTFDLSGTDDEDFARLMDYVRSDPDKVFCYGHRNRETGGVTPNTQFFVLVSADGGATWTEEDVTSAAPVDPTSGSDYPIEYVFDMAALG